MRNNHPTLESLEKAFREVAARANRLSEWMDLDRYLTKVEERFDVFYQEVQKTNKTNFGMRSIKLATQWQQVQKTDIVDLQVFGNRLQYINQPLSSVAAAGLATRPGTDADIAELVKISNAIEIALQEPNYPMAGAHCRDFLQRTRILVADREQMVIREVRELCDLTIQLHRQLTDVNVP